jgi:molybdopterin/thiamine biosynthesis adenylyltransferase
MTASIVFAPYLLELIGEGESRSHAFINKNFGHVSGGTAVTVRVNRATTPSQALLVETLIELLVRMEPVITTVSVHGEPEMLSALERTITARFPVRVLREQPTATIEFGVGGGAEPFIDATGWSFGCNVALPESSERVPVGGFLGALEAAKYIFGRAVEVSCEGAVFDLPWKRGIFDAWTWRWTATPPNPGPLELPRLDAVVAGCGGVAAGYLWFASKLVTPGTLALLDDDHIAKHNLNRLCFATFADAVAKHLKVEVAAEFMRQFGWQVTPLARTTESSEALVTLTRAASRGAVLISAVGEPMSRRALQRRGFVYLVDAATNSDGSIQVIGSQQGSACLDCYLTAPIPAPPLAGACGEVNMREFSGVVPHLSAGAGFLAGIEHLKAALGVPFGGVSVQPVTRPLTGEARERVARCASCPYGR